MSTTNNMAYDLVSQDGHQGHVYEMVSQNQSRPRLNSTQQVARPYAITGTSMEEPTYEAIAECTWPVPHHNLIIH